MQSVSSRIWTRVAVSISYDDNHYTMGTSDLNSAIIWMVSTRVLISDSSNPFTNPLVTIPSAPITIGITVIFMFNSFFNFLARSRYLSLFSPSFNFTLLSTGTAKYTIEHVPVNCWLSLGLVVWPRLGDQFVYPNPKEFCASRSSRWISG